MSLLRLAVLGPPEVFHDEARLTFPLRKAQALLLYLAVEGGMHSRSKLAALLWPDSEPEAGRIALRSVLLPLRKLLIEPSTSVSQHHHVQSSHDLLGLNPHMPFELDLAVVQQAYQEALRHSIPSSEEQRAALILLAQRALILIRGPFLDGFWFGGDAPFDEWRESQQRQWQQRLFLLLDRLSSWHEAAGEFESARATLTRWLLLDPLAEEASQRLMRVHLARSDSRAALQVYELLRKHLAEALQIEPSPESALLAMRSRALAVDRKSAPVSSTALQGHPPSELVAPLLGRAEAFRQLIDGFQQAQTGRSQVVLVVGEAGIGKTRLASEFVSWTRAQGAEVLRGHAFEMGGQLPYQPLVEALRERLEEENAPEDILEDVWLAELSRLLPELRARYPDLPISTEDELMAKGRLFEAVARLLDVLAQHAPLVLLVDDLQWMDEDSLNLLCYLGHSWKERGSKVLLLAMVRRDGLEMNPQLSTQLTSLERDLPVARVLLETLSQEETLQLITSLVTDHEHDAGSSTPTQPEDFLVTLGNFLFAQTGGQPLYLLEMLKLLLEREWLLPRRGTDGVFRLETTVYLAQAVGQERLWRELLPPSVRSLILARLSKLALPARQVVMASAVLGQRSSAPNLWQVAQMGVQVGIEALEEAVKSGLLYEEKAGSRRPGDYRFVHDLIRDVVYTEIGAARRQVLHQQALMVIESQGGKASEQAYHALLAGEAEAAYRSSVRAGVEAVSLFAVAAAIEHYEQARTVLQESQQMQRELPASEVEHLYTHLGQAYAFQNAWEKARETYEELLAYARQQRQLTLVSMALNRLAILALQQSFDKPRVYALLSEAFLVAERSHDQKVLAETEWNWAQVIATAWDDPKGALPHGTQACMLARAIHDQELEARSLSSLGYIHILEGDFEEAIHDVEVSLTLYAHLGTEQTASWGLSLAHILSGMPPTQTLTNLASEAMCWGLLGFAQVHAGQVLASMQSGRMALALSQEMKNIWIQVGCTISLTYSLLDAGAYEEALKLTQDTMTLARTLPLRVSFQGLLFAQGWTYHTMQQWDEASRVLSEEDAVVKPLGLGLLYVPALSQMCMHCAVAGEWEQAYTFAVQAITIRKSFDSTLIMLDFSPQYETEALLRAGDEDQAREEVRRLGACLGSNQRFRIPYLRSLAILAAWEGERKQAIDHLRETEGLEGEIGLPTEKWQIQVALGNLYEAGDEPGQARTAFGKAAGIIQELAQGIKDQTLRSRFLAGPQIHPVLQHAHRLATSIPDDHIEQSGL